jgi:tRNA1Val (adenine37-N6)-methyltransferase
VSAKSKDLVVDLGAGCGVISLILAAKKKAGFIFGIELQSELAFQAKRNIRLNRFDKKIAIIQGDLRYPPMATGFAHVVVSNPPYRQGKSGRINPHSGKAIARHEIAASLDDILAASKMLLGIGGKLALIYPANRLTEICSKMKDQDLEPKRLQIIFPDTTSHAKLAMIEGRLQGKSGLKILPPIFGQGSFSI